jgi:hypothetical protein
LGIKGDRNLEEKELIGSDDDQYIMEKSIQRVD